MKKLMQLVLLVFSVVIMAASCFAATPSLIDGASLLKTSADKTAVTQALQSVETKYKVRCAAVTVRDKNATNLNALARNYLDKQYKDGANGNMVLMVNMATGKWQITMDKKMSERINTSYGINHMGNIVVKNLSAKKYKDAFVGYARYADDLLAYYNKNHKPQTAAVSTPATNSANKAAAPAAKKEEKGSNMPMAAGGGVLAGILGAFGYGSSLKKSMSNVNEARGAVEYLKDGSFEVTESDDTFMYFTYARVPKAKAQEQEPDNDDDDVIEFDDSDDDGNSAGGSFDIGDDDDD